MAIRLTRAFGSTPEVWLGMQMAYDLAELRNRGFAPEIARIEPVEPAES